MSNTKIAYTVPEAARLLSISRSLLYELIHAGKIQSVKIGRARRITNDGLQLFVERAKQVREGGDAA